jgi:hypothetical protein
MPLPVGQILTFRVAGRYGACQVIGRWEGPPHAASDVVVFDVFLARRPTADDVRGAKLRVLQTAPRGQPLYLRIAQAPPRPFRVIGIEPVELGFALPRTYRTSRSAAQDVCPTWATWRYVRERLDKDLNRRAGAAARRGLATARSRFFPGWRPEDPTTLERADRVITNLAAAARRGGAGRAL